MLASIGSTVSNWISQHFPIWNTNRDFVLIVLCLLLATAWYWFWTRSRAAITILAAELLYLIPFVR
ncbi:MAG: hypothetical protein NZ561_00395 [Phycisphaerae bacterium]|nr:hypothetical protein [Phycisphaerae bacterium]MDW8262172.1 hypothetical protein [Phycisphaerales bacterium]